MKRLIASACAKRLCVGIILATTMTISGCASTRNTATSAGVENHAPLRTEIDTELMRELDAWFPRAVNSVETGHADEGGFHSQFDENWNRLPGQGRFVVFQSRLTWTAAEVARRRPALRARFAPIATHGVDFLAAKQWDAANGGFHWEISEPGVSGSPQYQEKHAYGISFGIYACATAYQANNNRRALNLAISAFRWLDQHAHDSVYGGYYEALAPDGTPVKQAPGNASADPTKDRIGTPYGQKSMNTHIHLLESFTTLYRVWPDRILRDRVIELYFLIRDRMPRSPGYLPLYYKFDWTPVPGRVSYGHDVETAYLLTEAAEALGMPNEPTELDVSKRLWSNTLTYGYDGVNGGHFSEGPPGQPADDRKKVWWVQAEALNSMAMLQKHLALADVRYWDAFIKSWAFIREHQIDRERGGWHDEISEDGTKVLKPAKSNDWKDPYHTVRALLNVSDTLRRLPPR